jgi:hypothetical protein
MDEAKESKLTATQGAAFEKIKILMREYAFIQRSSFLYTHSELLRNMEKDLSSLDEEYIKKYKIPNAIIKKLAREIYDDLMKKDEYDRAITMAEHYKL